MPILSSAVSENTLNIHLNKFQHLFATLEKNQKSSKKTDAYFSEQFVNRFGFRNPQEVVEYLKSPEGKTTLTLISQELIKIEALNEYKAEQYREALLRQERHLIFLLMGLIAKEKDLAKQASEITQHQIEQKLKETSPKEQAKPKQKSSVAVFDANIIAYTKALEALDKKLGELNQQLAEIDLELMVLENEASLMDKKHAHITDHIEQLNHYLKLPIFNGQSMDHYMDHNNQQIESLTTELNALKQQENNDTANVQTEPSAPIHRKIKLLEHRLAFHHGQLKKKPQCAEHVCEHLLEHIREKLSEQQRLHEEQPSEHSSHELEGLKLQEKGFIHALQVLRKEKILLNAELEEVDDFSQAHFIVDPSHKPRYQKRGDCYGICTEEMDPDNLSEEDWLQAQLNFEQLKQEIRVVPVHHHECRKNDVGNHEQRKLHYKNLRNEFVGQINDVKASKVHVLQALSSNKAQKALLTQTREKTPLTMSPKPKSGESEQTESLPLEFSPKPTPKPSRCSYAFMMRNLARLVPTKAPAPRKEDIFEVTHALDAVVPQKHQDELHQLINEVHPGEIMSPEVRLGWLNKAQKLIPEVVEPELEPTFTPRLG